MDVDDVLSSYNHAGELFAAMEDMEYTLEQNGSSIKKIISNELAYHDNLGLLNSDGSTSDGKFSAEDCEEVAYHHRYNYRITHYTRSCSTQTEHQVRLHGRCLWCRTKTITDPRLSV